METNLNKAHWNNVGGEYNDVWNPEFKKYENKNEMSFINKFFTGKIADTKKIRILDIGYGNGRIIDNYISMIGDIEFLIEGVDISESMHAVCEKKFSRNNNIKLSVANLSEEEIPGSSLYDFVTAIRVVNYNKNWDEIVEKVIKRLNKDGIFLFTMLNSCSVNRFVNPKNLPLYRTNIDELRRIIEESGGKVLQIKSFSKLPDFILTLSNNKFYVKFIIFVEKILELIFGDKIFGKVLFLAVTK